MNEPLPRRERKKAQTRKALLDVALRLIAERGIYATRIEDITHKSDLGKGAFYNYFPSKNALVAALVAQGVALLCDDYLASLAQPEPAADRIGAVILGHQAFFSEHPVFVGLFHQARGIARIGADGDDLTRVFVEYLGRIGDMLVRPEDRALTSVELRMDVAAVILGSIAGYRSFRVAAGLEVSQDAGALAQVLSAGVPGALARRPH
jgi:AcrR family transcriptional regulator